MKLTIQTRGPRDHAIAINGEPVLAKALTIDAHPKRGVEATLTVGQIELSADFDLAQMQAAAPAMNGADIQPVADFAAPNGLMRQAILAEILCERNRQILVDGHALDDEDNLDRSDLALAAASYALPPTGAYEAAIHDLWPFREMRPRSLPIRTELLRAAALIVAEIERLDRVEKRK